MMSVDRYYGPGEIFDRRPSSNVLVVIVHVRAGEGHVSIGHARRYRGRSEVFRTDISFRFAARVLRFATGAMTATRRGRQAVWGGPLLVPLRVFIGSAFDR